jgi:predicted RNA-binding Zn-ribbon protein involved in translation (DUF1610 family)
MMFNWNDHATNAPNTFKQLWGDRDFTDVTLATADDQQVKVHKVIISSCSQFFRNLLSKHPHPSPLIYLKGVGYKELERVLRFIYLGQCEVEERELKDFLDTGEDLGISGMVNSCYEAEIMKDTEGWFQTVNEQSQHQQNEANFAHTTKQPDVSKEYNGMITQNMTGFKDREKQVIIQPDMTLDTQSPGMRGKIKMASKWKWSINEYGKFNCDMCDKDYMELGNLKIHKKTKHDGFSYDCDLCDYKANQKGSLASHKQARHEGVRYFCDKCNFKSTTQKYLIVHKKAQHAESM